MTGNVYLVGAVRHHGTVVRVKGGAPMAFGRAQEEIAVPRDSEREAAWRCWIEPREAAG